MDILEAAGDDCLPRYLLTERERRSDDSRIPGRTQGPGFLTRGGGGGGSCGLCWKGRGRHRPARPRAHRRRGRPASEWSAS